MPEILTITLNPSLDLSATTPRVEAGPKLRLDAPVAEPGGGGINVARAALAMGGQVRAVAALGGTTGARVAQLLREGGVPLSVFRLEGETRQSLSVTDAAGAQYRFVMPGPTWSDAEVAEFLKRLGDDVRRLGPGAIVVLSGSQPPGIGADFPQRLVRALTGARVIVDTSGAPLIHLIEAPAPDARPHVLRMDQDESQAVAGHPLPDMSSSLALASRLVARGVADAVVLGRGGDGSVLATAEMRLACTPPEVPVRSKVGAGDSFTAGLALVLARGGPWDEALRLGTAAAAAAVMTPGTELCRGADVEALLPRCRIVAADA
ncbi:MAG: 1-phosphofructokinase family hexose kinase [Pararhodobacter sp.]